MADGKDVAEFRTIAARFNMAQKAAYSADVLKDDASIGYADKKVGSKDWGMCVLNFVVPGGITAFVDGGIFAWLAKGQYAKVGQWLIKVVGPTALKGGAVGVVASLAAGVSWCSTPWA